MLDDELHKVGEHDSFEDQLKVALADDTVPSIYFNGFINSLGASDIVVVLKRADTIVAKLHMSYTLGKTLAVKLGETIAHLEDATGNTIMTTDDIAQAMQSRRSEGEA